MQRCGACKDVGKEADVRCVKINQSHRACKKLGSVGQDPYRGPKHVRCVCWDVRAGQSARQNGCTFQPRALLRAGNREEFVPGARIERMWWW